jgi:mitochondrial fission protein ELM1
VILDQVYTVSRSGEAQKDLRENLQRLANIYEKYIRLYPHEYLWTYKIWKYGRERELLILSDGKTGHLRQSESAAKLIIQQLSARGIKTDLSIQEVKSRENRQGLTKLKPDIIISAGSSVSRLNYRSARQNQAKSIVLMRPANLSLKKFDLVIMPEHDWPPGRGLASRNVVVTSGALNLIDADLLKEKSERLRQSGFIKGDISSLCVGVLVGGDSKGFSISGALISEVISRIKKAAEELNADILLTTSRRTSAEVEQVIKRELGGYSRCKLLVIANENNHPDVLGGILGLSSIIITSPESISMISEAVSAEKYVVVFKAQGLSRKHRRFLSNYHDKGYIYLTEAGSLADSIKEIWKNRPRVCLPQDNLKVAEALSKIL